MLCWPPFGHYQSGWLARLFGNSFIDNMVKWWCFWLLTHFTCPVNFHFVAGGLQCVWRNETHRPLLLKGLQSLRYHTFERFFRGVVEFLIQQLLHQTNAKKSAKKCLYLLQQLLELLPFFFYEDRRGQWLVRPFKGRPIHHPINCRYFDCNQPSVRPSARENHNKGDPQLPPPPLSLVHLALPRCHSAIHYLGCCCFENCIDNELRYRAIPLIIQSNITTWMKNAKAIGSIHPSSYRRFFVQPVGVVQWKRAVYKIPSINWIAKVSSWISSP